MRWKLNLNSYWAPTMCQVSLWVWNMKVNEVYTVPVLMEIVMYNKGSWKGCIKTYANTQQEVLLRLGSWGIKESFPEKVPLIWDMKSL